MITLYQFSPLWGLPNVSPFCLKLETYLRMANLPFQVRYVNNPRKSPKGKLPFIKDEGHVVGDTSLIIDYLKNKYGDPLDQHLTAEQKAQGLAVQRLIEEHAYWAAAYARWADPAGWAIVGRDYFQGVPSYLRWLVKRMAQKSFHNQMYNHGMGRHSRDEIYAMGNKDITAITTLLGDKQFFFGDKPSSIDAVLYGFLANILFTPIESPLKKHAETFPNLKKYCEQIRKLYYK